MRFTEHVAGRYTDALLRAAIAERSEVAEVDWAVLLGRLPTFDDGAIRQGIQDAVGPEIDGLRNDFVATLAADDVFATLAKRCGLAEADAELLGVLAAIEMNENRQAVVAALRGATDGWRPTLGFLANLLPDASGLAALDATGALRRAALVSSQTDRPWARTEVWLDPAVCWTLSRSDDNGPPPPDGCELLDCGPTFRTNDAGEHLVLVAGHDATRRRKIGIDSCAGTRFVISSTPTDIVGWQAIVRFASLTGRSVLIELDDDLPTLGRQIVERADHLHWILSSRAELPVEQAPRRPWHECRADAAMATEDELLTAFGQTNSTEHRLTAHQVMLAERVLAGRVAETNETTADGVTAAVRRLASGELDRLATRIRPRRGWDDLVLPPDQLGQVRSVLSRYRHRTEIYDTWGFKPLPSAGVVAMFSGPPGTGKTLSAEIVAGELGLDLFRIDLASLISKYIGETEKNLEKIFQAAEGGTMVLLFDEADAVFGKRSEVSDANDKYANVETSYLLQRIETYDGIVILTTNYPSNIDEAFMRRIHVSVEFPQPDESERLQMWAQSFPPAAPLGELDLPFLARQFKLTGAAIRSISLAAAFRAADEGTAIGMDSVVASLRVEMRKQGRLIGSIDFGRYASVGL